MLSRKTQDLAASLLWSALTIAAGCGPEPDPQTDAGPDDEPSQLEVIITDGTDGVFGVAVAADLTDGTRIERVSDEDGVVIFELDVSVLAGLIAHRDGSTFAAMTPAAVEDALAADLPVTLTVVPVTPTVGVPNDDTANVQGAFSNRAADARAVASTTAARGIVDNAPGSDTFSLAVPKGQAFTLVGAQYTPIANDTRTFEEEHYGWTLIEHEGITQDTTIDIDYALSIEPLIVAGSIPVPANERLRTEAWLNVMTLAGARTEHVGTPPGNAIVGFASTSAPLPGDTGYGFTADYVSVPGVNVFTLFFLQLPVVNGNEWLVYAYADGPPQEENEIAFLTPPHRTVPERGRRAGPSEPWEGPISWTVEDEAATGEVWIIYTYGGSTIGSVDVSPRDTTVSLGALPSTSTTLSGGTTLGGHVSSYRSTDADPEFELVSTEGGFPVEDPFGS